jgi:hypothetical protein
MHPIFLSQAFRCLPYLNSGSWIDTSSIDIWLMHSWEETSLPQARYIPSQFIPPIHSPGEEDGDTEEIDRFRNLFRDLPDRGTACPLETLVYVMNCGPSKKKGGNHFCVVVFSPSMKAIYMLGRHIGSTQSNNRSSDWASWNGHQIWKRACWLMGWTGLSEMTLRTVDWTQNGYDCGPIACQVAQHIFLKGLRTEGSGQWKRPVLLGCCHTLRLKMAELVHKVVMEGTKIYRTVRDHSHEELQRKYEGGLDGMDLAHDEMEDKLGKSPVGMLHTVVRDLRQAIRKCKGCHMTIEDERLRAADQAHPIPLRRVTIEEAAARHKSALLKGTKSMSGYVAEAKGECEIEVASDEDEDEGGEGSEEVAREGQDLEGAVSAVRTQTSERTRIPAKDGKQARIGRFPRPVAAVLLPPRRHLRGLRVPFDDWFDDYEGGPALEELSIVPETHQQLRPSFMYMCERILLTPVPYSLFKDYGYRLLPCFGQSFDLGKPILVQEHLCPVGLSEPPKTITDYHCQRTKGRHGEAVAVTDCQVVGAEGLLEIADKEGDDGRILLTGMTRREGEYVCLDLLRDHVEPHDLHLSCDVDSVIWVTQTPKFKGPVAVYSVPVIRDRAPIWKDNHVQIQVLHPQTEDDQMALGARDDWQVTYQSLSTIPHLLFGAVQGSSVGEIMIFFPRMMHRDPHRNFRVNRIPKGIQDFFWDRVLLPALQSVIPSTRTDYLPFDRSHTAFKMGRGKHSAIFTMDPGDMERLIEVMKTIVNILFH